MPNIGDWTSARNSPEGRCQRIVEIFDEIEGRLVGLGCRDRTDHDSAKREEAARVAKFDPNNERATAIPDGTHQITVDGAPAQDSPDVATDVRTDDEFGPVARVDSNTEKEGSAGQEVSANLADTDNGGPALSGVTTPTCPAETVEGASGSSAEPAPNAEQGPANFTSDSDGGVMDAQTLPSTNVYSSGTVCGTSDPFIASPDYRSITLGNGQQCMLNGTQAKIFRFMYEEQHKKRLASVSLNSIKEHLSTSDDSFRLSKVFKENRGFFEAVFKKQSKAGHWALRF
ncbi:MAG: hypothetical protein K2X38_20725 [Gemmataceae bacterium]|nr:hypothetical protein [Gemmataceae bacterium]